MKPVPSPPTPRLIPANRLRHTLLTLGFATAVCTGMLLVRFVCAGSFRFSGLFGNLLLAWIPLGLTLYLPRVPAGPGRLWFWGIVTLWVLFFPNAFYLVTDLIHMKKFGTEGIYPWFDMMMTASFACGGMFLGCLSLYLMHLSVRQRFGWRAGWCFAAGMLAPGAFGVYLGRVLRLNSWDVVVQPLKIAHKISTLAQPERAKESAAFCAAFFFFSLAVYACVVSVARLHERESAGGDAQRESCDMA